MPIPIFDVNNVEFFPTMTFIVKYRSSLEELKE